ncbi:MAG TPA: TIGR03936 family radical SAM-associated protein [Candidatus Polarisedimenticolia bacterium]|nr:TIGR03936 family radical SAM-associated protein [Candidatus Polarisedimenticolia bacterium]
MNAEARQRWRVTFRRSSAAAAIAARELQATIEANLGEANVPVSGRTQLAAGLGAGIAAERELIDIELTERWSIDRARSVFAAALPPGHELVDCHDVWLGEPALAAQARGAIYRAELDERAPSPATLREAASSMMASERIARTRTKGGRPVEYDLRPLLSDVTIQSNGPPVVLGISVRIDPQLGTGRPEEVVAALAERCGVDGLEITALTRTRIVLANDPGER